MGFLDNLLNGQSFEKGLGGLKNCMERLSGDGLVSKIDELAENLESRAKKVKPEVAEKGNEKKHSNKPRRGYVVNSKGKKYRSLQKAIDEAKDGERLTITGDIHEAVKIYSKSISLIGTGETKEEWPIIWFEGYNKKRLRIDKKYRDNKKLDVLSIHADGFTLENLRIQGCSTRGLAKDVVFDDGLEPMLALLRIDGSDFIARNLYIANSNSNGLLITSHGKYDTKWEVKANKKMVQEIHNSKFENFMDLDKAISKAISSTRTSTLVSKAKFDCENIEIENVDECCFDVHQCNSNVSHMTVHDTKTGLRITYNDKDDDIPIKFENCNFYNSNSDNVHILGGQAVFLNCKFWGAKESAIYMDDDTYFLGGARLQPSKAKFIDCEIRDNGGYDVNMDHEECEAYFTNCKFSGGVTDGTGIDFNEGKAIFN